jgi:hypothetical protein
MIYADLLETRDGRVASLPLWEVHFRRFAADKLLTGATDVPKHSSDWTSFEILFND